MNAVAVPDLRIGEPVQCGALSIFPLYPERGMFPQDALDYLLSDEAQEAGTCVVSEASEEGRVGELVLENTGDCPVLLVEGEEFCQGKQNRVLLSSVLVGGKAGSPCGCSASSAGGGTPRPRPSRPAPMPRRACVTS